MTEALMRKCPTCGKGEPVSPSCRVPYHYSIAHATAQNYVYSLHQGDGVQQNDLSFVSHDVLLHMQAGYHGVRALRSGEITVALAVVPRTHTATRRTHVCSTERTSRCRMAKRLQTKCATFVSGARHGALRNTECPLWERDLEEMHAAQVCRSSFVTGGQVSHLAGCFGIFGFHIRGEPVLISMTG